MNVTRNKGLKRVRTVSARSRTGDVEVRVRVRAGKGRLSAYEVDRATNQLVDHVMHGVANALFVGPGALCEVEVR